MVHRRLVGDRTVEVLVPRYGAQGRTAVWRWRRLEECLTEALRVAGPEAKSIAVSLIDALAVVVFYRENEEELLRRLTQQGELFSETRSPDSPPACPAGNS